MSPKELWTEFEIHDARARDTFDRDTRQAWQIVRIYWESKGKKRMPDLKTLMSGAKGAGARGPSKEYQRSVLHVLSMQYGIPLQTRKRKRVTHG